MQTKSIRRRLGAIVLVMLMAALGVSACTAPPSSVKVDYTFHNLTLPAPGAGMKLGDNAPLLYSVSNVPANARVVLQRAVGSGPAAKWTTITALPKSVFGRAQVAGAPFGRTLYRVAILDAKGKLLASKVHSLDVYQTFTLGQLANRPVQTVTNAPGSSFSYYFQAVIEFPRTSCRDVSQLAMYVGGNVTRAFRVDHTIGDTTRGTEFTLRGGSTGNLGSVPATPGEDLELHVLDNATLGNHVYVSGSATCFTLHGNF